MSSDDRIRRPSLDRTEPIRAWSSLLGGGPLNDVVSRSVDLGYRVVDEYIRQGQKAAQRVSERSWDPATATGDLQELGARMAQYTSDLFGLWFEVMDAVTAGGLPRRSANGDGARPAEANARREREDRGRTRVRVEVQSLRPAEVSLDLRADAVAPLVAQALRSVDPSRPKLTDVTLAGGVGEEPLTIRVRVPPDTPPGVYNGLVVEETTSRPAGRTA